MTVFGQGPKGGLGGFRPAFLAIDEFNSQRKTQQLNSASGNEGRKAIPETVAGLVESSHAKRDTLRADPAECRINGAVGTYLGARDHPIKQRPPNRSGGHHGC